MKYKMLDKMGDEMEFKRIHFHLDGPVERGDISQRYTQI